MYTKKVINYNIFGERTEFYKDNKLVAVKDCRGIRMIPHISKSSVIVTRKQAFRYCEKYFGGYAFGMPELLRQLTATVDDRAYGYIVKRYDEEFIELFDREYFENCGYHKP